MGKLDDLTFAANEAREKLTRGTATMEGLMALKQTELKTLYELYKPRSAKYRPHGLSTKADYAEYLLSRMPEPRKPGEMDDTDALNAVAPYARNVWQKVAAKMGDGDTVEAFRLFETAFAAAYKLGYELGWVEAKAQKEVSE